MFLSLYSFLQYISNFVNPAFILHQWVRFCTLFHTETIFFSNSLPQSDCMYSLPLAAVHYRILPYKPAPHILHSFGVATYYQLQNPPSFHYSRYHRYFNCRVCIFFHLHSEWSPPPLFLHTHSGSFAVLMPYWWSLICWFNCPARNNTCNTASYHVNCQRCLREMMAKTSVNGYTDLKLLQRLFEHRFFM